MNENWTTRRDIMNFTKKGEKVVFALIFKGLYQLQRAYFGQYMEVKNPTLPENIHVIYAKLYKLTINIILFKKCNFQSFFLNREQQTEN